MSQPKWVELASADDWRILVDETGVYPPEAEIRTESQIFRMQMVRYRLHTEDEGECYLVPIPWFYSDLARIADWEGTDLESLLEWLCSDDPIELFRAYHAIGSYCGWLNFDETPRRAGPCFVDKETCNGHTIQLSFQIRVF